MTEPNCYGLIYFDCSNNRLSGSLVITGSTNLQYLNYSNNHVSGTIPSLVDCRNLREFLCDNNGGLQGYPYMDTLPATLLNFRAFSAGIGETTHVEGILFGLDDAGGVNGYVNLSGSTNATPTEKGYEYTASLKSKGWTVYTN